MAATASVVDWGHPKTGPPSQNRTSLIIEQARPDVYPERVGSSAANATWYLGSSRTDFVNRGSCISLFTLAILVLSVSIEFLFFFIPR
jgi:hypothetical protein